MTTTNVHSSDRDIEPAIDLPPGIIGFGLAEVAYLLSRHDGAAAARTRSLLAIDELATDDNFLRAGASSLVARGLLKRTEDGGVLALDRAAVTEYLLALPETWVEIGIVRGETRDVMLVVAAPAVTGILQPQAVGAWFISFIDGPDTTGSTVVEVMKSVRDDRPDASFVVRASDLDGVRGEVAVNTAAESGAWVVDGEPVDDAGLAAALSVG